MLQINGTADDVVPMRDRMGDTALNTETPVIEDVIDYLAAVNGCDQIWYVVIPHGTHCWPDYEMAGFDVNELILDYFEEYASKNF